MEYRAILVGAGAMGQAWARNLKISGDVAVAAWVDIKEEAAAAAAQKHEIAGAIITDDLGKAIAEARADFVVDVTVPDAHKDVTIQALKAGLPVLGEKPMAGSMADARAMVAASEAAGRLYMVSQSRRYDGRLAAYRKLIEAEVGPLGILNSDFYIGAHFGGFRAEMPSPLVLDMAIHTFDAARYLCADDDVVSVYCEEFNPSWSWYQGDACATALFTMASGLRYVYRGSWCSDGVQTSWEAEWRAVGPKGSAVWDGKGAPRAEVAAETGKFMLASEPKTIDVPDVPGGIAGSLQDFLNALRTGATPMGECHDNIKSLAMVFGAIESSHTGKRVELANL